jgi:hypothetical protein
MRQPPKSYGIIYEYMNAETGESAYVGKSMSLQSHAHALKVAHRRHLIGNDPVPFDFVLRDNPTMFFIHTVDRVIADTGTALQKVLKPLEKDRVRSLRPEYNRVRFVC